MAIYQALDWGLDDNEERELSPQLERLIERMAGGEQGEKAVSSSGSGATDEGYSGQEEEEEEEEDPERAIRPVRSFRQVVVFCASRLANPSLAPEHYQAVCRALFVETLELQTFLIKIRDAKEVCHGVNMSVSLNKWLNSYANAISDGKGQKLKQNTARNSCIILMSN